RLPFPIKVDSVNLRVGVRIRCVWTKGARHARDEGLFVREIERCGGARDEEQIAQAAQRPVAGAAAVDGIVRVAKAEGRFAFAIEDAERQLAEKGKRHKPRQLASGIPQSVRPEGAGEDQRRIDERPLMRVLWI